MIDTARAPSMTLLFGSFERLQAAIAGGQRQFGRFRLGRFPDGESLPGTQDGTPLAFTGPSGLILTLGVKAPAPGLDAEIAKTRIENAQLAPLTTHGAHMVCLHRGQGDPFATSLELFELAGALGEHDLLGAIHTPAEQCFRRDQIEGLLGAIGDRRDEGQLGQVLVNLIPLFAEGCTYYVTRGAQVLGTPEICLFDSTNGLSPAQVNGVVYNLLPYLRGGARFEIGHTAEFDGVQLTVEAVDAEYAEYIRSRPGDEVLQFRVGSGGGGGGMPAEGRLIVGGIVAAALVVAAADGSIDRKEIEEAVTHLLAKRTLADIGPYFEAAAANFTQLAQRILAQDGDKILGLVALARQETAQLHGDAVALAYGRALYAMAKGIAEASGGGLFGFGSKVSKHERAALEALAGILELDRA